MIEFLKSWVLNIVTLVTFIVLLEILIPSGKLKKFVNLVSGFILVIAMVNPFLGFLRNGVDLRGFQIPSSNFLDKREIEENSRILNEKQMKQVVEIYREKVIGKLVDIAEEIKGIGEVTADVIINEDYNSDNFGEIKRVYISYKTVGNSGSIKPATGLNREIENKICSLMNIDRENIVVSCK